MDENAAFQKLTLLARRLGVSRFDLLGRMAVAVDWTRANVGENPTQQQLATLAELVFSDWNPTTQSGEIRTVVGHFSEEFKESVRARVRAGETQVSIAREYGIHNASVNAIMNPKSERKKATKKKAGGVRIPTPQEIDDVKRNFLEPPNEDDDE